MAVRERLILLSGCGFRVLKLISLCAVFSLVAIDSRSMMAISRRLAR